MGFYLGLLLIALAIGFLAVRITQSRNPGKLTKNANEGSAISGQKPYKRKQKGAIGSGSRANPTSRAIRRSAIVAGSTQKPWGW